MGDETCRNCGAPFQYNCPGCGAPVKAGEPQCAGCSYTLTWPFHEEQQPGQGGGEAEGQEGRKRASWLAPLLGLVLLVAIVAAGVFILMRAPEKPAAPMPVDNSSQQPVGQPTLNDKVPPLISDITVDNTTYNSVEISWVTDEPSTSQVLWNPKGEYAAATPEKEALVTQHTVDLMNLKPKTIYYFKVKSIDQNRNEAVSEQKSFGIGIGLGKVQVVVLNHSMTIEELSSTSTRTYIKGEISNTGDLSVLVKDIEVPILITVAGRPQSEILAVLDSVNKEMNPGDSIKFSATVPNETDPNYDISVRIKGQ
jgi:hypothetical protein